MPRLLILILIAIGAMVSDIVGQDIDFNQQIRPILSQHCLNCHGADEKQRAADLRLDNRDDALAVIEPGDVESSDAFYRIISNDQDERMPPPEHGDGLTADEVELVRKWIEQGAPYDRHWSFEKPVKPQIPKVDDQIGEWTHNEIDYFVASKWSQFKLQPSPPSDPRRLIRRVALDLTGLPPSMQMVERYAATPTDQTYGEIVDELLASDSYGEHWTAMWLDLARYADTIGYAEDKNRTIWPWRDWVIHAFNANMPYDQFTIEQIAGDLLPNATNDQKLATAFHRNTLNNSEGGTSDEEFRTIAVKDRISTTVNVWMGLTMRCAECHTHKYDPISQTEYYQFLDFFNQTQDSDNNDERPRLEVYPDGRDVEFAKLDSKIEAINVKLKNAPPVWSNITPTTVDSRDGATLTVQDDATVIASGKNPNFDEYAVTFDLEPGTYQGLRLEVFPSQQNNGNIGHAPEGSFVLSQIRTEMLGAKESKPIKFSAASADHQQVNYGISNVIRDIKDKKGWAINHPQEGYRVKRTGIFSFSQPVEIKSKTTFKFYLTFQSPWNRQTMGKFRLSSTAIAKPAEKYKKKKLEPLKRQLENLVKNRNAPIRVPVMVERAANQKRPTHLMTRGSYLQPAEKVDADTPHAFHPLPDSAQKNRLAVARWLVADDNPLTARVTVNRFWARIFGRGIVETEEDFGTQGMAPTNQELIDWLAVDFQENGWDVKRLLKQIVTSSTYRQSSAATSAQLEIDPNNAYLSRGPRFRMRAEVLRDQALAVSGLLSHKMYGPPVYPPNPVKVVRSAFAGNTVWVESQGENRYRRAIYTYLKRSAPHPLFETFDMATREVCNMRRIRTNTPLQSFMTLNDSSFLEAAQSLAAKMIASSDSTEKQIRFGLNQALLRPGTEDQVTALIELYQEILKTYQDTPDDAKRMIEAMSGFGVDATLLKSKTGELASLTVVANVILNLDSFLTK